MSKILTIGSTVVDVFLTSAEFEMMSPDKMCLGVANGKMDVSGFEIRTGGGGGNAGVGFKRLGFDVKVISELGKDDLAELILKDLKKEGVEIDQVVSERLERTGGSVILVSKTGQRMILVHRGSSTMLDPQDVKLEELVTQGFTPDWVHMSNLSGRRDTLAHVFHQVKQHGWQLSWNPGSADLKLLASGECDVERVAAQVLFVNKEEWQLVAAQQEALANQVEQIVVTDGGQGGKIIVRGGQTVEYAASSAQVIDETGAGDAFCVGYVAALLKNKEVQTAAEWGAKNAASVVSQIGAKPGLLNESSLFAA